MKLVRKVQRKTITRGQMVYFIHLPPAWAREHYPGEVVLDIGREDIIIRPLKAG